MESIVHSGKLRNMTSVYLRKGNRLLLLFRQGHSIVSNLWIGSAGGHFENAELNDAKQCVLRELYEELHVTEDSISDLTLRYITLRYTNGEIRQNYYYFATLPDDFPENIPSTEGTTQWFDLSQITNLPMPFTARFVIDHYITTGQFDHYLYGGLADRTQVQFKIL